MLSLKKIAKVSILIEVLKISLVRFLKVQEFYPGVDLLKGITLITELNKTVQPKLDAADKPKDMSDLNQVHDAKHQQQEEISSEVKGPRF